MDNFWGNFLIEIAVLIFFGMLYYFYQKRKIIHYESNKGPLIMGYLLQSCLAERGDTPEPQMDTLIEAIDDYLQNKSTNPPLALLKIYADSPLCSPELKAVIEEALSEIKS